MHLKDISWANSQDLLGHSCLVVPFRKTFFRNPYLMDYMEFFKFR